MWRLFFLIAAVSAQIPSLGFCPDYQPMPSFNMNRFLGTWYESERYFTISELGSRCVATKYESTPEGRILVSNEITNTMTGMKRVLDGHLRMIGREGEGRMIVKYASLPVPYETEFSVLETDYDNYAVMWSCSGVGPVHIQNAWVLTRDRLAPPAVLNQAYAALEKFKVSRTFFVKTNQEDCYILPEPAAYAEYKDAGVTDVSGKHASMVPITADPDVEVDNALANLRMLRVSMGDGIAYHQVNRQLKKVEPQVKSEKPDEKPAPKEDKPASDMKDSMKKEDNMKMPEKSAEVKKDMPEMKEEKPKEKAIPLMSL